MITSTSLKSPSMIAKIRVASRNVMLNGYSVDHVTNKHGRNSLAVRAINGSVEIRDCHHRLIIKTSERPAK